MSNPRQEHFQANITIITYLKYDVILYYSNCMTFASESVFQDLNIITMLNVIINYSSDTWDFFRHIGHTSPW